MDNRNSIPTNAWFGRLVSTLAKMGLASQVARQILGDNPNGRTRLEIANQLRNWLANR